MEYNVNSLHFKLSAQRQTHYTYCCFKSSHFFPSHSISHAVSYQPCIVSFIHPWNTLLTNCAETDMLHLLMFQIWPLFLSHPISQWLISHVFFHSTMEYTVNSTHRDRHTTLTVVSNRPTFPVSSDLSLAYRTCNLSPSSCRACCLSGRVPCQPSTCAHCNS